jgi:ectoine hydroxylase-related dioxygenase (phytanoyl-CoA dioxygenase family)
MVNTHETSIDRAIVSYHSDGAAVLRGVLDAEWIARMQRAIDRIMAGTSPFGADLSRGQGARFYQDMFSWRSDDDVRALVFESPLPGIAAKLMASRDVRIFYDQMFVKEPGTTARTPWHQDLPYWPVSGDQVTSIWVPFDDVSPDTGVVTYVRGSHRWDDLFQPDPFAAGGGSPPHLGDGSARLKKMPDITGNSGAYDLFTWTMRPGDVILHHPRVVHGASGNASATTRRRALSIRYIGEDARFDDSHGHFMRMPAVRDAMNVTLTTGDRFDGEWFPQVGTTDV